MNKSRESRVMNPDISGPLMPRISIYTYAYGFTNDSPIKYISMNDLVNNNISINDSYNYLLAEDLIFTLSQGFTTSVASIIEICGNGYTITIKDVPDYKGIDYDSISDTNRSIKCIGLPILVSNSTKASSATSWYGTTVGLEPL